MFHFNTYAFTLVHEFMLHSQDIFKSKTGQKVIPDVGDLPRQPSAKVIGSGKVVKYLCRSC